MPTIHVSFCHISKPCDNFFNPMLEALKVLLRNVWGGESWGEWRVYGFILITLIQIFGSPFNPIWTNMDPPFLSLSDQFRPEDGQLLVYNISDASI